MVVRADLPRDGHHEPASERSEIRRKTPVEEQGLHRHSRGDTGRVHRGQHRHFQRGRVGGAAAAAVPRVGPGAADVQQLPRRRGGARVERCPRLLRPPRRNAGVRGAGALRHAEPDDRLRRFGPAGPRHERDPLVLQAAQGQAARWTAVRGRRWRDRQAAQGRPQLRALAGTLRRRQVRHRQGHPDLRQSLHHRRRPAPGLLLPGPAGPRVPAARLHAGTEVGRQPAQQQLGDDRPIETGSHTGAGPGPARRHQRRQHGSASALQGDPHQRQVLHPRDAAPG